MQWGRRQQLCVSSLKPMVWKWSLHDFSLWGRGTVEDIKEFLFSMASLVAEEEFGEQLRVSVWADGEISQFDSSRKET